MPGPHKIILCGSNADIASAASRALQPEYTAIYASYSIPAALVSLPLILSGSPPKRGSLEASFVTADYPPDNPDDIIAVVLGAGYTDTDAHALHAACVQACAAMQKRLHVPFFRRDVKASSAGTTVGPQVAVATRLKEQLRPFGERERKASEPPFVWY